MTINKKKYHGGYFDDEEQAAMEVNLLCDKYGKERKNPTVIIELDAMQQVTKSLSIKTWESKMNHFYHKHHAILSITIVKYNKNKPKI